nr:FecR domain-containing protein [Pedobacter sp. ASV19]
MKIERPSREALIRYYRGQCLRSEERLVALYLSMDIDGAYRESCLQEAWNDLNDEPPKFLNEDQYRTAWQKFQFRKINVVQFPARRTFKGYGYAASILLFLAAALALVYTKTIWNDKVSFEHFVAAMGNRQEIKLKDSSTVILFPGSTLDVPDNFNAQDRNVVLKGRAFFQVAHNIKKPFLVKSGQLTTRVLGTSFEVNGTGVANTSTITLRTGKVGVSYSGKEIARLVPNQRITYNTKINTFKIEEVNASQAMLWVDGELTYDLVSLASICKDMERWYNVKIAIKNPALLNKKITTSFKDLPVNKVLDMLSVTTGLTYTVKGNQITIN